MAFQVAGNTNSVAEVSGTTHRALRTEQRPWDHGALGAYRKSMLSGTMAAGLTGNSEIFQFRWSDATRLCAVRRVSIDGLSGSATAFTAGFGKIDLLPARSFTVAGTGGNTGTTTTNNGKMRTTGMGTSLVTTAADFRCASTAALGVGTKTLDTDGIGQISLTFGVVVSVQYIAIPTPLFGEDSASAHPLLLAQNEGFAIRATVPATGTWQFGVTVDWTELTAY